jgi:hypothetical protein
MELVGLKPGFYHSSGEPAAPHRLHLGVQRPARP